MTTASRFAEYVRWPVIKLPKGVTRTFPGYLLETGLRYAPTLKGRASRLELFATCLAVFLLGMLLNLLDMGPVEIDAVTDTAIDERPWTIKGVLIFTALLMPIWSVIVRRLHDINRYGWSVVVVFFPYVGWLILLVMLLWNGEEEENGFGLPPHLK